MIISLSLDTLYKHETEIKFFFSEVPFGRYLSDHKLDKKQAINLEYNALIKYLSKGEVFIALDEKHEIEGVVGFHYSEWDTNIFNNKMAIIQYYLVKEKGVSQDKILTQKLIDIFHSWVIKNQIKVVVTKIETKYFAPVLALQNNGFIFFETNTYRTIDVEDVDKSKLKNTEYRFANKSDMQELKSLALKNTFKKSHFYLDSNFDVNCVEKMYAKWIDNALNSSQRVLVIEEDSKIVGVFIYENLDLSNYFEKQFGVWKFAAVDGSYRNKGLGQILFNATFYACIQDKNNIIDTDLVEKNIISQNFHDKLGFRLVNTLYTFHKWF